MLSSPLYANLSNVICPQNQQILTDATETGRMSSLYAAVSAPMLSRYLIEFRRKTSLLSLWSMDVVLTFKLTTVIFRDLSLLLRLYRRYAANHEKYTQSRKPRMRRGEVPVTWRNPRMRLPIRVDTDDTELASKILCNELTQRKQVVSSVFWQ